MTPQRGGGFSGKGAKLMISNLDYGVSDADVKVRMCFCAIF